MSPYINFSQFPSTQKGDLGEYLVDGIIASTGAQIYTSQTTNCSHYLDRFFISSTHKIFAADAKAKAARSLFSDSGVDRRHFDIYKDINKTTPFIIYFVDEFINSVYGNYLDLLLKSKRIFISWRSIYQDYPFFDNNSYCPMVYFPLENMVKFGNIDEETSAKLKQLSKRNYPYPTYRYPENLY